jgi:ribA/ribD-fused uncharacterized protein
MNTTQLWEATNGRKMWDYNGVVYFWGHSNEFGFMSNWYPCLFTIGSWDFNCVEQYMMFRKAMVFGDQQTAMKVMAATEPREHKKLGREVKGFDAAKWDAVKVNVVMMGVAAKFAQNPELHARLMSTKKAYLVEASPYDAVWGAGLDEAACRKLEEEGPSINHMPGENLLGKILCYVRDEMLC